MASISAKRSHARYASELDVDEGFFLRAGTALGLGDVGRATFTIALDRHHGMPQRFDTEPLRGECDENRVEEKRHVFAYHLED